MAWRHYETRNEGTVSLCDGKDATVLATYRHGIVSTGRSRVFAGHFVQVILPSGTEFTGEDEHSLRSALLRLASSLSSVDLITTCSGLDPRWRESGLSENTGWGYFVFYPEAVHMMTPIPPSVEKRDALDREKSGTVSGMRIGLHRD
jgi:hypothetical protein